MISFTYFALENITISKENIDQDEGEHDGEAQGQVTGKKYDVFSRRLFICLTFL